jgi:serine phosphatase RsbU (regulator of sigma subunit)/anti-sigma regulatory factor (Ser/Thr protein kinase)
MTTFRSKQLNLDKSLLVKVCEAVPRGMLIADPDGTIVYINDRMADALKINPDEEIGKSLRLSKIFGSKRETSLMLLVDESKPFKFTTQLRHHDEDHIWEFHGSIFAGGFLIEGEDVTEELNRREILELREQKYERQVAIAQRLQRDIFPSKFQKKRIDVNTYLITADDLAGDFFSITDLGPNSIGVVIGDVVGKGIPASLMAMSIHTLFMQEAKLMRSPNDLLSLVNGMIHNRFKGDFWYATAFYARITMKNLTVTYARAGHEFPLWYEAKTGIVHELSSEGLPLGMFSNPFFETRQIQLGEGDRLIFFTDGLPDALNSEGERFGRQRLIDILKSCGKEPGRAIFDNIKSALSDFIGDMPVADDIAFAVFAIVPDMWTTWEIPPRSFDELLDSVMEELIELGVDEDNCHAVRLAVDECVINAQQHGNNRRSELPVVVSYLIDSIKATFKIRDSGSGFDYENLPDPTLEDYVWNETGRGVYITRQFMDEVAFNEIGNEITITKNLKPKADI